MDASENSRQTRGGDGEYKVFRGDLFNGVMGRRDRHGGILEAFGALEQMTTQQLSEYESEVTDLKSALWTEMAARMDLDATVFQMKLTQGLESEKFGKVTGRSPRGNEMENVSPRGSPTPTRNSLVSDTAATKMATTAKATRILSPSNGKARTSVP